jgi:hypothetical protein
MPKKSFSLDNLRNQLQHPKAQQVLDRLMADQEKATMQLLFFACILGSKEEWSMEDNFETTEGIARVIRALTGVKAGNQDEDDLAAWREIARKFGYGPDELGYEEDEDED